VTEVLAVVPARGGSRGLPGKNMRTLAGRTLVARAVQAALDAKLVTRVVGSTDDEGIAAELRRAGAEVPWLRPGNLAADDTPDTPVFRHVLDALAADGYRPDIVVNVRPTAPLRTGTDIDNALGALLATPAARSVKCVSETSDHPYKMWTLADDGLLRPLLPDWRATFGPDPDLPRQSLPTVYLSSGAVDAVWVDALEETGMFHPGPVVGYVLDRGRDVDIDDTADLAHAERLLEEDER
jgi:CMP-N,N'-diacetyllegionaminic acid synthase